MAKKFILADDRFKMSAAVEFHSEMVQDRKTVKGGGRWFMDQDNKILYLWDQSQDFGPAKAEDIKAQLTENRVSSRLKGYKVMHSIYLADTLPAEEKFTELCIL